MRYFHIYLSILILLCFFALSLPFTSVNAYMQFEYTNITAMEAKELIEQNPFVFILDVRSWGEFTQGHISNAVNIPYNQLPERAEELPDVFSHLIIVYCDTGARSAVAASTLIQLGYTNVNNIQFGLSDWTAQGYSLVTASDPNQILSLANLVFLVLAGLIGVAFGFILQRGRLCFNSALKKAILDKDFTLLKVFALTAAILTVVYFIWYSNQTGIVCSGAVLPLSFSFITLLAGIIFGVGMILAESCLGGISYKAGAGYGGAIIALIGAFSVIFFLIQPPVVAVLRQMLSETLFLSGIQDVRVVGTLSLLPLVILMLLFGMNWQGLPTKEDFRAILQGKWVWWFSAILLASVGAVRLFLTFSTGSPATLGISGGFISLCQLFTQQPHFLLEGIIVLGGLVVGSFLSAKVYGEFQVYIPPHRVKVKFFLGGVLLATGAILAAGCNLAHLSAGLPQLTFSSILFLSTVIITNSLGHYLLERVKIRSQTPDTIPEIPQEIEERDPRETVIWALTQLQEATTTEIIDYVAQISHECKDRVSGALATLLREDIVKRTISKKKKGFVWSLS
ncbi:MAG: YeeE/YedE thiosulfate transporter family protein [Candidatus Hermodarchaeota archaeon]